MLMAAGRRGFGVHESRKRNREFCVDADRRKARICREYERGFGDLGGNRGRYRSGEEKELGELSSDSQGSPPAWKAEERRSDERSRKGRSSLLARDTDDVKKVGVIGFDRKVGVLVAASLPPQVLARDGCVSRSKIDVLVKTENKLAYPDRRYYLESNTHQNYSLDDEAEGCNADAVSKKKGGIAKSSLRGRKPVLEFGEILREGSYGMSSQPSVCGSVGKCHKKSETRRNEHRESGGEGSDMDSGIHLADEDSDLEEFIVESLDPVKLPQRRTDMLQCCRNVDEFERLNKINEGTYGVVYRARDKKTGGIVALKKVKMEKEREGFPLTSLREINILLSFKHPSIVDVKEVVMGSENSIFIVMEYMDHDLKGLMDSMKQPFSQSEVKCLMLQLLEGVKFIHDNWVLHRDLKTSNLLFNNRGELKICDFGMSRLYGSPLKPYTPLVVTLWYRAPELLLGMKQYSTAIDLWSLGCIMAEMLSKEALFNGKSELDQLDKIFRILGMPNENLWPGFTQLPGAKVKFVKQPYNKLREKFPPVSFSGRPALSESGFDLLNKLLTYDPDKRITAEDALGHEWFREVPLPKSKDFMPTFPSQNTRDRHLLNIFRSPDPLEELRKELQQA